MKGFDSCVNCGWCVINNPLKNDKVCCNTKSPNYNNIFFNDEAKQKTCNEMESQQAVDYVRMNAWEFASKYYG